MSRNSTTNDARADQRVARRAERAARNERRTFTTEAAADYIGLAPITLRKLRVSGDGPAFRIISRRAYYERADLDAYIDAHPKYRSTSERDVALAVTR